MSGSADPEMEALIRYWQGMQARQPAPAGVMSPMLGAPAPVTAAPIPMARPEAAYPIPTPPPGYATDAVRFPPDYYKLQNQMGTQDNNDATNRNMNMILQAIFMHRAGQT